MIELNKFEAVPHISIEYVEQLSEKDLQELCEATESALQDASGFTIGFKRTDIPVRAQLEAYWKGVLMVPERQLIVGKLDNVVASSVQLVKPAPSNQTSAFSACVENHFVAPWARGHGLARELLKATEEKARKQDFSLLKLSVRADQHAAIHLYETSGYVKWGTLEKYELINGQMMAGYFYSKDL